MAAKLSSDSAGVFIADPISLDDAFLMPSAKEAAVNGVPLAAMILGVLFGRALPPETDEEGVEIIAVMPSPSAWTLAPLAIFFADFSPVAVFITYDVGKTVGDLKGRE
jgi:hypothetical protein